MRLINFVISTTWPSSLNFLHSMKLIFQAFIFFFQIHNFFFCHIQLRHSWHIALSLIIVLSKVTPKKRIILIFLNLVLKSLLKIAALIIEILITWNVDIMLREILLTFRISRIACSELSLRIHYLKYLFR